MKKTILNRLSLRICFYSFFFIFSNAAGQEALPPQKQFQHEVTVSLKLIQVYVTDKKGKPVHDLSKDDFVVVDNGQVMKLTEFEKRFLGAAPQKPQPPPPEDQLVQTAIPPAQAINRKIFFFFDFAFNHARGIDKAKEAARLFLATKLLPGDEIGLLSYSLMKGLTIHEYLTNDPKKISEAIANFGARDTAGRAEDFEDEYWRHGGQSAGTIYAKSRSQLEAERKESKYQVQNFILTLTDLAKAFRYVPGKKNVILFSTGIITSLIYYGMQGAPAGGNFPLNNFDTGDFVLRTRYEEMLKELTASDCSVFAFDTREAALVSTMFDTDKAAFEDRSRLVSSLDGAQKPINVFKDDKITGFYTLNRLAEATGGIYYSNIEEYQRNLDNLQALTGSYYVLGYPINERWDGKFHEIIIEVKKANCAVKAQSGYYSPKPFSEYSNFEKQLHLMDLALSELPLLQTPVVFPMTGLAYSASWGPRLLVVAKIPTEVAARFAGRKIECVALVFDEKENLANLQRLETDLTKSLGMDVIYLSESSLQPGNYKCRLVIRDLENGQAAVASAQVNIPAPPSTGLKLHTPLLLVPGSNSLYLEPEVKKGSLATWDDACPYLRTRYSPLIGEVSPGTSNIFTLIPCSFPGLGSPEISMTAWLIETATGARIPISGSILDRLPNVTGESILAEISLEHIAAGRYRLYLQATDTISKALSYTQTLLVIR